MGTVSNHNYSKPLTKPLISFQAKRFRLAMSNESVSRAFHRFSYLPYDLRDLIWQTCLPHRAHEIDRLWDDNLWQPQGYTTDCEMGWNDPPPCQLWPTAELNKRPPMITRVCREAREIAFKAMKASYSSIKSSERVQSYLQQQSDSQSWFDKERDSPHLYMEDDIEYLNFGKAPMQDPLGLLAALVAKCKSKKCSFGIEVLEKGYEYPLPADIPAPPANEDKRIVQEPIRVQVPGHPNWRWPQSWRSNGMLQAVIEDTKALEQLQHCQVVFGLIVVHCSAQHAAGRFGLFGDAPIQIVDFDDRDRMADMTDFAKICEEQFDTKAKQDFECVALDPALARRQLEYTLWMNGYPKHLYQRMHPAIMFRLCTHECNTHIQDFVNKECSPNCMVYLS